MASGIAVNPKCIEVYEALNKRAYGGAIFKINPEMTEVALEKTFEPNDTDPEGEWKAIIGSLPKDECRYILTDFKWKETPTVTKSKVMLVLWSSEIAAIKFKMIYASSLEQLTSKMHVSRSIQATDQDEISYAEVKKKCEK